MGSAQIPDSSNPVRANWKQSKTFLGFKSGAASLTFFFHLFPLPPFFLLIFFSFLMLGICTKDSFLWERFGESF